MTELREHAPSAANLRRTKVYVEGPGGLRVPFVEVPLGPSPGAEGPVPNPPVRLYDTSGPGSTPTDGLPPASRAVDQRPGRRRDVRGATVAVGTTAGPPSGGRKVDPLPSPDRAPDPDDPWATQ